MAWIKRNLIFVIAMAIGVLAIGAGGYFVYAAMSANNDARDQYNSSLSEYTQLQQKTPYPSEENLKVVREDSKRVAALVTNLGKAFVNFPPPPHVESREFIKYLNANLAQFRLAASNANVALPLPDYAFTFSGEVNSLSFNDANLDPWMQQLEEIRAILDILCNARINSLDALQQAPAPMEDPSGNDFVPSTVTSNQVSVVSPYRISFRGFSEEIAAVLKGFAESSHCFLVKDVEVLQSKGGAAPQQGFMQQMPMPNQPGNMFPGGPRFRGPTPPPAAGPSASAAGAVPTGPVTVLKPSPLFVTIVVNVVKLNNTQH